jgi:hypothetical protein
MSRPDARAGRRGAHGRQGDAYQPAVWRTKPRPASKRVPASRILRLQHGNRDGASRRGPGPRRRPSFLRALTGWRRYADVAPGGYRSHGSRERPASLAAEGGRKALSRGSDNLLVAPNGCSRPNCSLDNLRLYSRIGRCHQCICGQYCHRDDRPALRHEYSLGLSSGRLSETAIASSAQDAQRRHRRYVRHHAAEGRRLPAPLGLAVANEPACPTSGRLPTSSVRYLLP